MKPLCEIKISYPASSEIYPRPSPISQLFARTYPSRPLAHLEPALHGFQLQACSLPERTHSDACHVASDS